MGWIFLADLDNVIVPIEQTGVRLKNTAPAPPLVGNIACLTLQCSAILSCHSQFLKIWYGSIFFLDAHCLAKFLETENKLDKRVERSIMTKKKLRRQSEDLTYGSSTASI